MLRSKTIRLVQRLAVGKLIRFSNRLRFAFGKDTVVSLSLALFAGAAALRGSTILTQGSLVESELANPSGGPFILIQNCVDNSVNGCNGTAFTVPDFSGTASAKGSAGFGLLRASASAVGSGSNSGDRGGDSSAFAEFADTFTISSTSCPACAAITFVDVTATLDGFASFTGTALDATGGLQISLLQKGSGSGVCTVNITAQRPGVSAGGPRSCTAELQLSSLSPFSLDGDLGVDTEVSASGSGSALASFSNTAFISGIQFLDAKGQPLTGVNFATESGTVYPVANSVVPEPPTGVTFLVGFGLLFLGKVFGRSDQKWIYSSSSGGSARPRNLQ